MPQQFGNFIASELYCPKCKRAQPVRERLLLVLPSGELHEYLCSDCGSSLGERTVSAPAPGATAAPRTRPLPVQRRLVR
jgi:transposase-like protein